MCADCCICCFIMLRFEILMLTWFSNICFFSALLSCYFMIEIYFCNMCVIYCSLLWRNLLGISRKSFRQKLLVGPTRVILKNRQTSTPTKFVLLLLTSCSVCLRLQDLPVLYVYCTVLATVTHRSSPRVSLTVLFHC